MNQRAIEEAAVAMDAVATSIVKITMCCGVEALPLLYQKLASNMDYCDSEEEAGVIHAFLCLVDGQR